MRGGQRMRPTSALLAASMLLGFTAQASSHLYIGDGANSCGAWTQERAQDSQRVQLWKGWVLGFVSGVNNISDQHPDFLKQVDAPAIYAWIDNYCRSNPLDHVFDATVAMVQ